MAYAAIIGKALEMAGTQQKAYGLYAQGQATANAIQYNLAIQSSADRINQAAFQFNIDRQIEVGERFLATQRQALSKAGIQLNGSAIEVMQDTARQIELDVFNLTFARDVAAFESDVARRDAEITAKYAKKNAKIAMAGAIMNAASSTASSALSNSGSNGSSAPTVTSSPVNGNRSAPIQ